MLIRNTDTKRNKSRHAFSICLIIPNPYFGYRGIQYQHLSPVSIWFYLMNFVRGLLNANTVQRSVRSHARAHRDNRRNVRRRPGGNKQRKRRKVVEPGTNCRRMSRSHPMWNLRARVHLALPQPCCSLRSVRSWALGKKSCRYSYRSSMAVILPQR